MLKSQLSHLLFSKTKTGMFKQATIKAKHKKREDKYWGC